MRELLTNTARSLIFSTALPPPAVAAALAALEVLQEQPEMVDRLQANADAMRDELAREGFEVAGSTHADRAAGRRRRRAGDAGLRAAIEGGVFAQAIRPPTVPAGTSRLRLALMATHTARSCAPRRGRSAAPRCRPASGPAPACRSPPRARRAIPTSACPPGAGPQRGGRRRARRARRSSSPGPTPRSARPSSPRR